VNENRVRIVIEVPAAQAVQGVGQVVNAVDGLGVSATGAGQKLDATLTITTVKGPQAAQGVRQVDAALDGMGTTAATAGQKADAALTSTTAKTQELARAGKATADGIEAAWQKLGLRSGNAIRADIAETVAAYKRLAGSGQTSGRDLEAALAATKTRVVELRRELARTNEVDSLKNQVKQARQFAAELDHLESLARTAGAALVSYLSVRELAALAQDIMAVGMQFDALRNSLKTTAGDSATAADMFRFVHDEANRLGLGLLTTGDAYAKLAAAAKGTSLEGEATQKIFSGVAEAARALHLSSDQTSGALLALQQMISKGTVQAEELRGQLGERLPGAFNLAAQAMGVTTSELGKMLEQGQVLAVDMLPKLAEALHQAYGAGAAEAAASAAAEMERLKNTVAEYKDMVYSAFSEELAGAIRATNSLLNENKENVNLYLLGIKGYAASATTEIKAIGDEAGISANKIIEALKRVSVFGAALDVAQMVGGALRAKGQEAEQHKGNQALLDEILTIAKNGQKSSVPSISQADYNKLMGLAPSYDSDKLMSGVPLSALSKLQKSWSDILPKIAQVNKEISSGKLQGSGLEKALGDRAKLYEGLTMAQGDYQKSLDKGSKAEARAALAAERYGESASAYYDQVIASLEQLQDSLTGGTEKNTKRVDAWFDKQFDAIRQKVIGAKGDVSKYAEAWVALEKAWPGDHILAATKDTTAVLQKQSQILQDIAQATGDPAMKYEADKKAADAWYAEKRQLIESSYQDEAQKTAMLAALQDGYNAKLLEAKTAAYKDLAGVSDQYWEAERSRIEAHLAVVKKNATDETAYKIYAAQQWDAYNKALLEKQEQYAGTFAETLAAKWALAYGTYKSEATRAKEAWEQTSQSIIDTTNGIIDGVSGGIGDMVRSFADGTGSIEDLFQTLKSRAIDIFANMIEELIRKWLTDFVGRLGSGEGVSLGSLFGSSSSSGGGGSGGVSIGSLTGGTSADSTAWKTIGKTIGSSIMGSFSSGGSEAASFLSSLSKSNADSISDVFRNGNISGWTFEDGSSVAGDAVKSAMGLSSTASSLLSSTLGIVGAIGGVVGLVSSLFSSSEKTEKTGSGYKIAINAGTLNMSGVDFYKTTKTSGFGGTSTSYSTVSTGMVDPDVAKQVNDTLKETAEQLHDFGKVLGFSVDILDSFSMPEMTITDSQLQGYMRNTSNAMAFSALEEAGLRGAFDYVADEYEVYVDEFERLADAYKVVGGYTEAYGYDLETLAGITADQISEIRQVNTETAQGTAQALLSMASSMGATEAQLAELAATASDGSQALAVTDEQLSKILQADYASDLIDAVGGEDAFSTLMTNLVKNTLDSVEAYEENATYYAGKAGEAIEELGRSGVTIANFWDQFDEAMHSALTVEEFEKWADAAGWVNALNVVTDALDDWADTVAKAYQSLDVRAMQAQGLDYQAELAELLASAEWELVAAREAGYDAAYLARLAEVQALEYAAKIAEHAEDYAGELREAQKRYATAIDDSGTLVTLAIQENQAELQKLAKEYNWSPGSAEEELFQTLQRAQWAEIINMIQETADATAEATRAMRADLEARRATIAGYDEEAQALQMVAGFADELAQAYADGIDPDLITDLMSVQMDELAAYWADTLDQMESDLRDLYQTQSDLLNSLTGNTQSAIEELYGLFERYQAGETDLADSIIDSLQAIANAVNDMVEDIYSTIYEIRTGEDYRTDTADVAAANARTYFEEQYNKAAAGDTEAMSNITSYATSYLSALKSSTADESVYRSGVDWITSMLSQLAASGTGIGGELSGIGETVTDDQIEAAREALRRAEVAQAKSKADALLTQAQSALQGSDIGNYIAAFATTGVGWQGVSHLLDTNTPDGTPNWLASMRAGNTSIQDIISWLVQYYGTGTGYVDWASAVPYVASLGILPSGVSSLYQSYQAAQDAYLALKSQYGFALGGVISSPSTAGDNTLVFANGGERVLTPRQNDAFEELVFGGGQGGGRLVEALIARVDRLTDAVDNAKKANTEENRAMARRLTSIASQVDDWALNGSLQVGVKGPVEVTGTVEVAP